MILTSQIVRPLVLEWLSKNATGTVQSVVSGVMDLAFQKKLVDIAYLRDQPAHDRTVLFDHVQTVMWQLLPQSILVWGLTDHSYGMPKNDSYPFYRLTEYGKKGVIDSGSKPQPYDPALSRSPTM